MFTMCSPCISSCVHCVYSLTPLQYVLLHCTPSLADSHIGCVCSSTGLLSPLYCVMWLVCGCIVLWLLICCYGNVWGVEICTDHVPVMLPPATVLYMSSCVVLCVLTNSSTVCIATLYTIAGDSHIGCVCSSTGLLSPLYCVMWLVCGCIVLWLMMLLLLGY